MAEIKKTFPILSRDNSEELGLLPDRFYIVFKPNNDEEGSFDVIAYDTTESTKNIHPVFYVMKGILEVLQHDMDRLISLGQMAVVDKVVSAQESGMNLEPSDLDSLFKKINIGKKH
jgi:hypothetical protein